MVNESSDGPSKRPRMDNCIDLAEDNDLWKQRRVPEEEYKQMKEVENKRIKKVEEEKKGMKKVEGEKNKRMKKLEEENKELRGAMEDLRGMVECPVCLLVPRQGGPVPVCSNGHFVCRTCRDRIRQEALDDGEPKCPSCMVVLGNATSLLASRVIEKVRHECEHDGCEEMIPFADLEKHQLVCWFRKVLCPGSGRCKLEISFNQVDEHSWFCDSIDKSISDNELLSSQAIKRIHTETEAGVSWPTDVIASSGKTFFIRSERKDYSHFFEAVMLGSEAECKGFLASMTILDEEGKVFTRKDWRPRPISMVEWGNMGLVVSEKDLSTIWWADRKDFVYDVKISVTKV